MGTSTSYAGGAAASTITSDIDNVTLAFQVAATTGWPNTAIGPFVAKIDGGTASEEKIQVTSYDGSGNLTVASRGYDGKAATTHTSGAPISPCWDAVSAQDDNQHIYDTTRDDHSQYLIATRHDSTTRHTFGTAGTHALGVPGTPTNIFNAAGSAGTGSVPSRSDHQHAAFGSPASSGLTLLSSGAGAAGWTAVAVPLIDATSGDISTIVEGDAAAAGAIGKTADAGHVHGYPRFTTPNLELLLLAHTVAAAGSFTTATQTVAVAGWYLIIVNIFCIAQTGFAAGDWVQIALQIGGHTSFTWQSDNGHTAAASPNFTITGARVAYLPASSTVGMIYQNDSATGACIFADTEYLTTIASASNGVVLPTSTINVASTTGFAGSGTIVVQTASGGVLVDYTSITSTAFDGCTLGTGEMDTGMQVGSASYSSFQVVFLHA